MQRISSAHYQQAAKGKFSNLEYVTRAIKIESFATEKTRSFYIHVFLPWAKEHRVATHPERWYLGGRPKPTEDLLPSYVSKGDSYWRITNSNTTQSA